MAVIGAVTLLYAGLSALAQNDIKRVLAYSTISQIGYMFLALGVGAWSAAIFHFMTHAFFKALLFLAAGLVIKAMDEEHDIRKMGGLRRDLPVVFWLFLIGAASLSALPAGDGRLLQQGPHRRLWRSRPSTGADLAVGWREWSGALLTSLYAFRLVFLVFFGERRQAPGRHPLRPGRGRARVRPGRRARSSSGGSSCPALGRLVALHRFPAARSLPLPPTRARRLRRQRGCAR